MKMNICECGYCKVQTTSGKCPLCGKTRKSDAVTGGVDKARESLNRSMVCECGYCKVQTTSGKCPLCGKTRK